jgi:hypothetical protein
VKHTVKINGNLFSIMILLPENGATAFDEIPCVEADAAGKNNL